uniref:uncharacterized protein LOC117604196 n=1 Tax=Osmia lignaria TaxID=473952 RepID=UPI0014796CC6|nr:uncharacterized protein LOC117604196 [Osmia lignaria]
MRDAYRDTTNSFTAGRTTPSISDIPYYLSCQFDSEVARLLFIHFLGCIIVNPPQPRGADLPVEHTFYSCLPSIFLVVSRPTTTLTKWLTHDPIHPVPPPAG